MSEAPCPVDAPNDGKPCDGQQSSPGTGQTPLSDGPAPTLSDLLILLVRTLQAQTEAIYALAESNERLVDELAAQDETDDGDSPGHYMDGTPILKS